jgi:hypothetical protein
VQPFLQQAESADVVERGGGFHDFNESVLFQCAGFLAGDDFRIDALGFHDGQGKGVFGLGGGQAQGALQRGFAGGFREVFQLRGFGDAVEHGAELGGVGQVEIDVGDFVFEFGRELEAAAEQDEAWPLAFATRRVSFKRRTSIGSVCSRWSWRSRKSTTCWGFALANMPSSNWRASSGSGQAVTRLSFTSTRPSVVMPRSL